MDRSVIARLVLGSSLMLFLELALIRWLGSNIVHLSYFSNFVLLGSFLGIGCGFLIARKRWSILPADAGAGAGAGGRGAALPGLHRPHRRGHHLLHLAAHLRAAGLGGAAGGVHRGGGRAGRAGRGGRPVLLQAPPADGLPLGPDRFADRHQPVHAALVPPGAVGRLGRAGRGGHGGADGRLEADRRRGLRRRADRRAAARDVDPGRLLVAVLQGADHRRRVRRPGPAARPDRRQRGAAPADGLGRVQADAGRGAVPARRTSGARSAAGQRADRRRRLGFGRRDRLGQGRQTHRRRGHRSADPADRQGAASRSAVLGPAGDPARQRRSGVPGGHRPEVRPDPVRAARLARPGQRRLADPARVVPVHRTGADGGPGSPESATACSRCTTTTASPG